MTTLPALSTYVIYRNQLRKVLAVGSCNWDASGNTGYQMRQVVRLEGIAGIVEIKHIQEDKNDIGHNAK